MDKERSTKAIVAAAAEAVHTLRLSAETAVFCRVEHPMYTAALATTLRTVRAQITDGTALLQRAWTEALRAAMAGELTERTTDASVKLRLWQRRRRIIAMRALRHMDQAKPYADILTAGFDALRLNAEALVEAQVADAVKNVRWKPLVEAEDKLVTLRGRAMYKAQIDSGQGARATVFQNITRPGYRRRRDVTDAIEAAVKEAAARACGIVQNRSQIFLIADEKAYAIFRRLRVQIDFDSQTSDDIQRAVIRRVSDPVYAVRRYVLGFVREHSHE